MSDMFPYRHPDWADDDDDLPRIHFWEVDDEGNMEDVEPPPDLGPCCSCSESGWTVRNIMMLHRRAPTPGFGWGCFQCGLPSDGAIAVLCDACVEAEALERTGCPVVGSSDATVGAEAGADLGPTAGTEQDLPRRCLQQPWAWSVAVGGL